MTKYQQTRLLLVIPAFMTINACTTTGSHPPRADIQAITEAKPIPPPEILTDPVASDRHNNAIESWGERLHSAGLRLCRYYKRTGVDVSCN